MSDDDASIDMEEQLELAAYEEMMAKKNATSATVTPKRAIINNIAALDRRARDLSLDKIAGFPLAFSDVLSVTGSTSAASPADPTAPTSEIDGEDDLKRELGFYQQALYAVTVAQQKLAEEGLQFTRPSDYFAEMVKSDHQMMKIRQRLVDESQAIKKSEEAKKQRELRKFGKSIQVQKLQDRQKQKADTLEKISSLKRKRKNGGGNDDGGADDGVDPFEIALDDGNNNNNNNKNKRTGTTMKKGNTNRSKKDAKFGFGGKKRHGKSNTRDSTDGFDFNQTKNKQLPKGFRGAPKPTAGAKVRTASSGGRRGGKTGGGSGQKRQRRN